MAEEKRKFGNREMQKRYDESRPKEKDEPKAHEEPDGDEQPIEDSVAEHGPAEHVEMHTHHADGHVHKSTHHDAESAHDHVGKAFEESEPMKDEEAGAMGGQHSGGSGIPTMA
jgi:hypothetical protein